MADEIDDNGRGQHERDPGVAGGAVQAPSGGVGGAGAAVVPVNAVGLFVERSGTAAGVRETFRCAPVRYSTNFIVHLWSSFAWSSATRL